MLAEVAQRGRCDRQHLVALTLIGQAADQFSTEFGYPADHASLFWRQRSRKYSVHIDPGLAPDLERAGIDRVGRGCSLGTIALLEHDCREP